MKDIIEEMNEIEERLCGKDERVASPVERGVKWPAGKGKKPRLFMAEKIYKVYEYMKQTQLKEGRDWVSPTEIGVKVGGPGKYSAWGSPVCKRMVELGLLERNEQGHYKAI